MIRLRCPVSFLGSFLSLFLSASVSRAQDTDTPPPPPPAFDAPVATSSVSQRMDRALAAPGLKNALVGVRVLSLDSGRIVYERNPDFALMPASNQKILTAAVALHVLKPDFRFTTTVAHTGTREKDGVLHGDLILKGGGDPSLTSARLTEMARKVKNQGVRRITGHLIVDDTRFDGRFLGRGWQWDNEPYDYQPQISALNCDVNIVEVTVTPNPKAGEPPLVDLGTGEGYLTLENTAKTVAAPEKEGGLSLLRARAKNVVQVSGTVALGAKPIKSAVTVESPSLFSGFRFLTALKGEGIEVGETVTRALPSDDIAGNRAEMPTLAFHQSEPLSAILKAFMKPSDNLYGEVLLKAAGAAAAKTENETATRPVGTTAGGERALRALLKAANIDASGLQVADGSGLSRNNTVTPRLLTELLAYIDHGFPEEAKKAFWEALPIGGVDGTLRRRFVGTPAEGKVRAKTGSLNGVSALSGYMTTKAGERLVFSILMNHYASGGSTTMARTVQDELVLALIEP